MHVVDPKAFGGTSQGPPVFDSSSSCSDDDGGSLGAFATADEDGARDYR